MGTKANKQEGQDEKDKVIFGSVIIKGNGPLDFTKGGYI